ncbi:MAG: hypothetical protein KC420_15930, partial [Myxococcales bacterium]|nr:hypothetical protein [Myxococcales bacterium]
MDMVDGPGDRSARRRHALVATTVEVCVATLLVLLVLGPALADHGAIAVALTLLTTLLARGVALVAGAEGSPRGQALAPWLLPPLALIAAAVAAIADARVAVGLYTEFHLTALVIAAIFALVAAQRLLAF